MGLSKLVDAWVKDHGRRNLKMLSRLSGVPYTSLRRIVQGEVEPNLDQALSILSFVASGNERMAYLEQFFPDSAKMFKSMLGNINSDEKVQSRDAVIERYFEDPEYCEIIELADSHQGLAKDRLRNVFGLRGLNKVTQLIDDEILEEDLINSKYKGYGQGKLNTVTFSSAIKRIKSLCDMILRTRLAVAYFRSESVNEAGILELKKIVVDAYQRVAQVVDNPEYQGDIPLGFSIVCGRYHDENIRS